MSEKFHFTEIVFSIHAGLPIKGFSVVLILLIQKFISSLEQFIERAFTEIVSENRYETGVDPIEHQLVPMMLHVGRMLI